MSLQIELQTVLRTSEVGKLRLMHWGFRMTKAHLKLVSPNIVNGTVPPKRPANTELRTREYLTEPEIERLIRATKHGGRYAQRDATLILTRSGMGYVPVRSRAWNGHKSNGGAIRHCTSVGRRRARLQLTLSLAMNYGRCANYSGIQKAGSCSRPSVAGHSQPGQSID